MHGRRPNIFIYVTDRKGSLNRISRSRGLFWAEDSTSLEYLLDKVPGPCLPRECTQLNVWGLIDVNLTPD